MYAVYQNTLIVSPVYETILDAGDWQSKFANVLSDLEVRKFEDTSKPNGGRQDDTTQQVEKR